MPAVEPEATGFRNRSRGHGGVGCRVGFAARSVE